MIYAYEIHVTEQIQRVHLQWGVFQPSRACVAAAAVLKDAAAVR
jgi:hypothetical protein